MEQNREISDRQQEFEIKDSNIIKLGFIKCENCEDEPICPHAGIRRGCRTRETIKEITFSRK